MENIIYREKYLEMQHYKLIRVGDLCVFTKTVKGLKRIIKLNKTGNVYRYTMINVGFKKYLREKLDSDKEDLSDVLSENDLKKLYKQTCEEQSKIFKEELTNVKQLKPLLEFLPNIVRILKTLGFKCKGKVYLFEKTYSNGLVVSFDIRKNKYTYSSDDKEILSAMYSNISIINKEKISFNELTNYLYFAKEHNIIRYL